MGTVIGIDLGTSTTEAAVICDGKPVMVLNPEKEIITPSAVGLDSLAERDIVPEEQEDAPEAEGLSEGYDLVYVTEE